jgi:hypothetical protein
MSVNRRKDRPVWQKTDSKKLSLVYILSLMEIEMERDLRKCRLSRLLRRLRELVHLCSVKLVQADDAAIDVIHAEGMLFK